MTRSGTGRSARAAVVAGRNPVAEILSRRPADVEKVYVQKGASGSVIQRIVGTASGADIPVQYVPKTRLDRLAPDGSHQGVVAMASEVRYVELEALLAGIGGFDEIVSTRPRLVVLDRIQDPHNYGAILRSAAASGVHGVVVPATRMAPLSPATVKASAGTAGIVPIARVTKLLDAITQLKERGFWVVGLDSSGSQSIWNTNWQRPVAIVIGSEGEGMADEVRAACDEEAHIPMPGNVESLNASVAAGIVLFVAARGQESE